MKPLFNLVHLSKSSLLYTFAKEVIFSSMLVSLFVSRIMQKLFNWFHKIPSNGGTQATRHH